MSFIKDSIGVILGLLGLPFAYFLALWGHSAPRSRGQRGIEKPAAHYRRLTNVAKVGAIVCVVLSLIAGIIYFVTSSDSMQVTPTTTISTPAPVDIPSPSPTPQTAPLPDGDCPTPSDLTNENKVSLTVYYWCRGFAVLPSGDYDPNQFQLKVRLGISNMPQNQESIRVSLDNPSPLRVLIPYTSESPGWNPPTKTAANGDKPVCVTIKGSVYWAIPPNINDDAQKSVDGNWNFASHWHPEYWGYSDGILPVNSFIGDDTRASQPTTPDKRGNTNTDLVFTLPGLATTNLYGLVLFDTKNSNDASQWRILGACEQAKGCMTLENQLDPSTF
jgi:hypothetical protein